MFDFRQKLWRRGKTDSSPQYFIERPLVLLQSDDWGRVGVRDQEGYEALRAAGIRLGERSYDFYTLETSEDVTALRDLLKRHRDSTGRSACLVMNFVMANLDFPDSAAGGASQIPLLPLTSGLPGKWKRPGLFEAYRSGIADKVFFPALHGLTHFCQDAVEDVLSRDDEKRELLRTLWKAETPYIYWRTPWVGYEYCHPEKARGFLPAAKQSELIGQAVAHFEKFFSHSPVSACAPGYRSNDDTHAAWAKHGIRVAQNGSGAPTSPRMDQFEILNLDRTIDFEPSQKDLPLEKYMQLAESCFARGVPAIISVHSINFHSTLRDFRGPTLQSLDNLLTALETKFPNLLYVHDGDAYEIVTRGKFRGPRGAVSVKVTQQSAAAAGLRAT